MKTLSMDFQEGFDDDTVSVLLDGREVYQGSGITTRTQVGLAASFNVEVGEGPIKIEVFVSSKGLSDNLVLDMSMPVYVGVSAAPEGGIVFTISDRPFGYL